MILTLRDQHGDFVKHILMIARDTPARVENANQFVIPYGALPGALLDGDVVVAQVTLGRVTSPNEDLVLDAGELKWFFDTSKPLSVKLGVRR